MKHYGLIGETLHYSFSKQYFTQKFEALSITDTVYNLYELTEITEFVSLIKRKAFSGLNVTIPYKQSIIPYLDDLSEIAEEIQAVNTIQFQSGKLIGHNTDVIGFQESVAKLIGRRKVENALILGSGGASQAIIYALHKMNISTTVVSRSKGDIKYAGLDRTIIKSHRLIVNCTPLGTFPDVENAPDIPYKFLNKKHLLFDLVYNPEKSLFLKNGDEKGCKTMNGMEMLIGQAEAAWKIWNTL